MRNEIRGLPPTAGFGVAVTCSLKASGSRVLAASASPDNLRPEVTK